MHFKNISIDRDGDVAIIALNRPDRLNAYVAQMGVELCEAFDMTDAADDVRAVIITGRGRAFCAGADMAGGGATFDVGEGSAEGDVVPDGGGVIALRIFNSLKPVIGAINGPAIGLGATMTLPMDIRLASTEARFGFVFTRRGIAPEACSSWFLPRIVGISTALEWSLSGAILGAEEAQRKGLVRSIHAPEELLSSAIALARSLTEESAPVSVALTRQMMWRMLGPADPMEAHRIDSRVVQSRGASADAREGVESFLAKRKARFPNRVSADMPSFFPWWPEERF